MDQEKVKKIVVMNFLYAKSNDELDLPYNFDTISTILKNNNIFITRDKESISFLRDCLSEFNENSDDIDMYMEKNYPAKSLIKEKKKIIIESDSSESEEEIELKKKSNVKKTKKTTGSRSRASPELGTSDTRISTPSEKKEKTVYEKPGQRYDTPSPEDPKRLYYSSLYAENPESKPAKKWLVEHGITPEEETQGWSSPTYEGIGQQVDDEGLWPSKTKLKREIKTFFKKSRIPIDEVTPKQIRLYLEKVFNKPLNDRKDEINEIGEEIITDYLNKQQRRQERIASSDEEISESESDEKKKKPREVTPQYKKIQSLLMGKTLKNLTPEEKEISSKKGLLQSKIDSINTSLRILQGKYYLYANSVESLYPERDGEEIEKLKKTISVIKENIKNVLEQRRPFLDEIENYPMILGFDNEKKKEDKESKIEKELEKARSLADTDILTKSELDEIKKLKEDTTISDITEYELDEKTIYMKNLNRKSEEKIIMDKANYYNRKNLPYFSFLTNFIVTPIMLVEDPNLDKQYKQYPDLSIEFKSDFKRLTTEDKYKFIKYFLNEISVPDLYERIKSSTAVINYFVPEILQKYIQSNPVDCSNVKNIIDEELMYNTMYYFRTISPQQTKPDDVLISVISLLKEKTKCDFDTTLENYTKELISSITKNSIDYNQLLINVHNYQYNNQDKYVKEDEYFKNFDQEDQHLIQRLYLSSRPPIPIEYEEETYKYKPLEGQSVLFAVDQNYALKLSSLADVFNKEFNRKKIFEVVDIIEQNIGNKKLDKEERKQIELDSIEEEIKDGSIPPKIGEFLKVFIELYGSVEYIPKGRGTSGKYLKSYKMFNFENVDDLPPFLRESAYNRLRDAMIQIDLKKLEYINKNQEQNSLLAQIQYEMIKPEIDKNRIIDLINGLNIKQEIKAKLLYLIDKKEWNNIYIILEQAHPGRIKKQYDPLVYLGIQRNNRMLKNKTFSDQITKIEESIPSISEGLKKCLELQALHPWYKTGKDARYFIADVNNQSKFDMDESVQLFFGKKIEDDILDDKNYYTPTNLFWKKYCTDNFIYTKGPTMCNEEYIIKTYTSGSEQLYVLGIYDPEKQKELRYKIRFLSGNQSLESGNPGPGPGTEEVDKLRESLRNTYHVFTEEDFKKQCEWIETKTVNFGNYMRIIGLDLVRHRDVREAVRSSTLEHIKKILNDLYVNKNITSKSQQIINRESFELEQSIYELTLDSSATKKPIYVYYKILHNFTIFMEVSSPLYNYSEYFRTLFITTYMKNYKTLLNLSIVEKMPEIYLLPNKKEFMVTYMKYIDSLIEKSIRGIMTKFDSTVSKPTRPETSYPDFKKLLNIVVGKEETEKYKNICENYDDVENPYLMLKQSNGKLYCMNQDQITNIINDKYDLISNIPMEIREKVQNLFIAGDNDKDMFTRLNIMRVYAKRLAKENFGELNYLQYFESIFGKEELDYKLIDRLINEVEQSMNIEMNEKEKELFTQQLFAESHKLLLTTVKKLVDSYWEDNKSVLNEVLAKERLVKEEKYGNNIKTLVEDRNERYEILKPMFEYVNTNVRVDDDMIYDSVIDYISQHKVKMPEIQREKAIERETLKYLNTKNCYYCSLSLQDKMIYTTYVIGEVKSEDKVVQTSYPADFCGRECFMAFETKDVDDNQLEKIKIHVLVGKLIEPYGNIEYMKKYIKKLGLIVPENSTYGQMYASLLVHSGFEFEIFDIKYKETMLNYRKEVLDKLADYFKIDKRNTSQVIFNDLKRDPEFFAMFMNRVRLIGEPVAVYQNILNQKYFKSFMPGCEVDDSLVNQYVSKIAENNLNFNRIKDFDFGIFFTNFFKNFKECSYLTKSIKNVTVARGMQETLQNISEAYFALKSKEQAIDIYSIVDEIAYELERGTINLYKSKGVPEEEAILKAVKDVDRTKLKNNLLVRVEMISKLITSDQEYKLVGGENILNFLIDVYERVYIDRKNSEKQIDSRFLMDDVINKLGIVLEISNVSVDTYRALVQKLGTLYISKFIILIQNREISSTSAPKFGRKPKKASEKDKLYVDLIDESKSLQNEFSRNSDIIRTNVDKIEENKDKIEEYSNVKSGKSTIIPKFQELIDKLTSENKILKEEIDNKTLENDILDKTISEKQSIIENMEKEINASRSGTKTKDQTSEKPKKKLTLKEQKAQQNIQPTPSEERKLESAVNAVMTTEKVKEILTKNLQEYIVTNFPETSSEKLERKVKERRSIEEDAKLARKRSIQILDVSSRTFIVIGDLTEIRDELKNLGGSYNPKLDVNGEKKPGMKFDMATKQFVEEFINNYKLEPVKKESEETDEVQSEVDEQPYDYVDEEEIERPEIREEISDDEFENIRYEDNEKEDEGEYNVGFEYNPEEVDEENDDTFF